MTLPPNRNAGPWRILNRDGKFNITSEGGKRVVLNDLYYLLVSASWPRFFATIFTSYLVINVIFATAFFFCGPQALEGIRRGSVGEHALDCFFFSVQTVATIGYGRISPSGLIANLLVTLEALTGLLMVGLMTGLLFSRFSRSSARVVFSNKAVMSRENGQTSFLFRLSNERMNQVTEAKLHVTLVKTETTSEGEKYRKMYGLKLDRNESPLFMLSWTVIHTIDDSSPLYGMTDEKLRGAEAEILVGLTGTDNAFAQPIHARFSYTAEDIVWEGRFADMLERRDGNVRIFLNRIHDIV